ncbi:hypothetical protein RRG08_043752 [Elysia crispata]|uniref:Uncharacterized protein n=1 Tax=Elysia crispata TaxID=231223 RepID=A0AAE0ZNP5_9GAST|nr:hypothetical protein RRG08_043752 [Elysia crispata]
MIQVTFRNLSCGKDHVLHLVMWQKSRPALGHVLKITSRTWSCDKGHAPHLVMWSRVERATTSLVSGVMALILRTSSTMLEDASLAGQPTQATGRTFSSSPQDEWRNKKNWGQIAVRRKWRSNDDDGVRRVPKLFRVTNELLPGRREFTRSWLQMKPPIGCCRSWVIDEACDWLLQVLVISETSDWLLQVLVISEASDWLLQVGFIEAVAGANVLEALRNYLIYFMYIDIYHVALTQMSRACDAERNLIALSGILHAQGNEHRGSPCKHLLC